MLLIDSCLTNEWSQSLAIGETKYFTLISSGFTDMYLKKIQSESLYDQSLAPLDFALENTPEAPILSFEMESILPSEKYVVTNLEIVLVFFAQNFWGEVH